MGVPPLGASAGRSTTRSTLAGDQRERARADRPLAERMVGQARDRHVGEQVGRGDGLGRGLQEPADRRVEREPDRPLADGLHGHPGPGRRRRARVVGVLQGVDREGDVGRGDRLAVVPERVVTELERPRPPSSEVDQREARSGTTLPLGPLRTSPANSSATRSRSACERAVSGLIDSGWPRTPSR